MLSRVADALYWIGRYVERAGNVARYADVNHYLSLDLPAAGGDTWTPLVQITGDLAAFLARHPRADARSVLRFLSVDDAHPGSIVSCLRAARENARAIRDAIPMDMWALLHRAYATAEAARDAADIGPAFFEEIKQATLLFTGTMHDTFARDEGWRFWRLGQQIERADQTSRLLDVKYFLLLPALSDVGSPLDELQWTALLKSVNADVMYRKRHGRYSRERIVEFLLLDRDFPRAAHACLIAADEALHGISGGPVGTFRNPAEQRLGQLRAQLAFAHAEDIILHGFHEFIDAFQGELNTLDRAIRDTFMSATPPPAHFDFAIAAQGSQ